MPYITKHQRDELDMTHPAIETPGELNYFITTVCLSYLADKMTSYQTICEITGVLENVKLEFYRRVVVKYEEEKIKTNGDVY
jgi:hypothetical protein